MEIFKEKLAWLILGIMALLVIFISLAAFWSVYILYGLALILLLLIFIWKPELGIYAIVFLYPFTYFEFVYKSINVPYVDLVAIVLFMAWLIRTAYFILEKGQKFSLKNFPAWFFMGLFVLAASLSLMNVEYENFNVSLKYILRPIIFFYLMFVILPFNVIDSLKKLFFTFKTMFVLGIGLGLMGIWSIIITPSAQLKRAAPTEIFGFYPLGSNWNSLAEVLVCLVPVALILFWYEKNIFKKNIYLLGALFIAGVNLLTLSRAGWLALAFELLLLALLRYRKEAKNLFLSYLPYFGLLLLAPILYLMYNLFNQGVIARSDVNRLDLIALAINLFKSHPLIGSGVGTFTIILSQAKWYILEYGSVLDAHGFIFKTLAETGLLGTISFVLLLGYILYILLKAYIKNTKNPYALLILGGFLSAIGGITFQLFNTSYFLAKMWLPIGLALVCLKLSGLYFEKKNQYGE